MGLVIKHQGLLDESGQTYDENTASATYTVLDDTGAVLTTIAAEVALSTLTPSIVLGSGHPNDSSRKVKSIKAYYLDKQRRDLCGVDVSYSSAQSFDFTANPLLEPAVVSTVDTDESEEEYYIDTEDNKCILTNGKPITPRPKRKKISYKVIIKKNVATTYADFSMNNTVNSGAFSYGGYSWGTGQGHLIMSLSDIQERGSYKYRVLTMAFNVNEEGHKNKYDSRDKEELGDDGLQPIKDGYGREIDFPAPLNEDGSYAGSVDADPFEIELKPYNEANHGALV